MSTRSALQLSGFLAALDAFMYIDVRLHQRINRRHGSYSSRVTAGKFIVIALTVALVLSFVALIISEV